MASKSTKQAKKKQTEHDLAQTVRESAHQIWLAGLGAFAKAQEEGTKVFDALVKEGEDLHRKTSAAAGSKFKDAGGELGRMASDLSSRAQSAAGETWDKLEQVFEDRVARALKRLGVPAARELEALAKRVEQLSDDYQGKAAARKAAGKSVAKSVSKSVRKTGARKAPARKAPTRLAK
jgi:poly(hydroxyalkanoate) granule-associated protein